MTKFLRYFTLGLIGLANALPIPLVGSVLSIWLNEYGFDRQWIGLSALLAIPFCFKIFWTPLVDHITFSWMRGRERKSYMIFSLLMMAGAIFTMGGISPGNSPVILACAVIAVSLFTGCLYITGLAYELESLEEGEYGKGSAWVVSGYRLGLLFSGAGVLLLSDLYSWSMAFQFISAILMAIAIIILLQKEPFKSQEILKHKRELLSTHPSIFKGFWKETIVQPCRLFFDNPSWISLILIVLCFKIGDHFAKSMSGPFLLSLGFNKTEIATAYKMWGMVATISGAFIAGIFLKRSNALLLLGLFGLMHSISLSCFVFLALIGKSYAGLYLAVTLENFTGGMAMTAFITLLWRSCSREYAQVQYTLLWSFFTLKSDLFATAGGFLAAMTSWPQFFLTTTLASSLAALLILTVALRFGTVPQKSTKGP